MAIRKIRQLGDEILRKKCREVPEMTAKLKELVEDMYDTMYEAEGVGLAAPQVGILRRAIVVIANNEGEGFLELVNPEIIFSEGEQTGPEGCLSVPGKWGMVTRPSRVRVRAQDRYGEWFEVDGEDLLARCFCHEVEHLDGHLYVEHIDRFMTEEELEAYYQEHGEEMGDED